MIYPLFVSSVKRPGRLLKVTCSNFANVTKEALDVTSSNFANAANGSPEGSRFEFCECRGKGRPWVQTRLEPIFTTFSRVF